MMRNACLKNTWRFLAAVCSVCWCVSVQCAEQTSQPSPPKFSEGLSDKAKAFVFVAGAFRVQAASDFATVGKHFQVGESFDFLQQGKTAKELPDLWSYFFSGCIVLVGNLKSDMPVVAYYNSFVDGAVFTQWDIKKGAAKVISTWVELGSTNVIEDAASVAPWLTSSEPALLSLAHQTQSFIHSFEKRFPTTGRGSAASGLSSDLIKNKEGVEGRAFAAMYSVLQLYAPTNMPLKKAITQLQSAFAKADRAELQVVVPESNPLNVDDVLAIPQKMRTTLVPALTLIGKKSARIFLIPPEFPMVVVALEYEIGSSNCLNSVFFINTTAAIPK